MLCYVRRDVKLQVFLDTLDRRELRQGRRHYKGAIQSITLVSRRQGGTIVVFVHWTENWRFLIPQRTLQVLQIVWSTKFIHNYRLRILWKYYRPIEDVSFYRMIFCLLIYLTLLVLFNHVNIVLDCLFGILFCPLFSLVQEFSNFLSSEITAFCHSKKLQL